MANWIIEKLVEVLPSNNRVERIWKLAQVEFQSRFYNDRLGLFWALIKPLFEVTLYYIVFTYFYEINIDNYAIYLFGGIVIWMTFAEASMRSLHLFQNKLYLIDNIQFNKIDIFLAHIMSISFSFIFNYVAFMLIAISFGAPIHLKIIPLIIVIASLFLLCLGVSLILASIQPFLRDINHVWDMAILVGFWTSGILYKSELIFEGANWYAHLNPMVGLIYTGRACVLHTYPLDLYWLGYSLLYSMIVLILGLWIFNRFSSLAIEKL